MPLTCIDEIRCPLPFHSQAYFDRTLHHGRTDRFPCFQNGTLLSALVDYTLAALAQAPRDKGYLTLTGRPGPRTIRIQIDC